MDYFKKINTLSLAEMIKSARKSLYLCLPSLHPEISQAIAELNFMQNMPEETVQIHILVDFDANTFRQGYGDYESMESLFMEGDDIKCLKDNRISFIICDNIGYYLFIESRTMIPADKETINAVRIDPISIVRLKSYFFPDIDKTDIKDELANAIIEESQTLSSPEKLIPETPAPISVISDEEIREVSFNLETNPPLNPDFKRKVEFYKNKIEMEEKRNIIIYNTADGKAKVALYAKDGMVWMNQNQLAELFDTSKQNISQHIINILNEGELQENSVVKNYLTTAEDGKEYNVTFYSLEMILAIGFRVRSKRGTQFRIWANKNLREYMVKGFVMDDERLKNPDGRPDYFDELLERIRDIRASEKRFYQKVRDLFALSSDYDPTDKATQMFFAETQNKLLFAVTGKTAAEIIVSRADANKPNMALTSWKGGIVRKQDIFIAKNYLTADEIDTLNRLVVIFLETAELRAKNRIDITMDFWRNNVDKILELNDKLVLNEAQNAFFTIKVPGHITCNTITMKQVVV